MYVSSGLAIGYQSAAGSGRVSLAAWMFWVLLLLVLFLAAFILIRDKALRERLGRMWSSVRRRVRKARLKGKIKKETQSRSAAVRDLGKAVWSAGLSHPETKSILEEIKVLEGEKGSQAKEMEALAAETEKLVQSHEAALKILDSKIRDEEGPKKPETVKLAAAKESSSLAEKEAAGVEKELRQTDSGLKSVQKSIARLEADDKLGEEQRAVRSRELKTEADRLAVKKAQLENSLPLLVDKKSKLRSEEAEIQKIVGEFERKIEALEAEKKQEKDRHDRKVGELRKKRSELERKAAGLERRRDPLLESLGNKVNELRPADQILKDLYARIDKIDGTIRSLEEEVRSLGS